MTTPLSTLSTPSAWRKSTFSTDTNCVEVAALDDGRIAMRNSKVPDDGVVFFTRQEIDAFFQGVMSGEFDDFR